MNALTLGRQVKYCREQLGITQKELADRVDISLSTVKFIETGRQIPKLTTLEAIAEAFGYDIISFLRLTENNESVPKVKTNFDELISDKTQFIAACKRNTETVCDSVIYESFYNLCKEIKNGDNEEEYDYGKCDKYFALAELALKIKGSKTIK